MPTGQKSPLHPSTLTINDLTRGRRIIRFNIESGVSGEYIVVSPPQVYDTSIGRCLMVDLRSVQSGYKHRFFLTDLGVVRGGSNWNSVNFVIDHRKRHLLPEPLGRMPWLEDWELFDEAFGDEDDLVDPFFDDDLP